MADADEIRATVEEYVSRWNGGDGSALAELFHPDATVADPVDEAAHRGRDAIAAFFTSTFTSGMDATLAITGPIRVAGRHAAFPMQVSMDLGGQTGRLDIIDTMEFDEDGSILAMAAYWDAAAMEIS
ncbi:MAG: SgcJ/EcaC family oxidoreductase [Acidimicrobiia bacterium]|nr:SgcJ/EcaC family oxidoreductase [Acidimicrobiia bacterium]MDH5236510.1 SgcJ/EcaC family oxidoreductase [Acidimicrobiia bacterium]